MIPEFDLPYWAHLAAIGAFLVTLVGAIVGIYGYTSHRCRWKRKTNVLVNYLRERKRHAAPGTKGQQTATHLIRHVGLTEDEILKISFESRHVARTVAKDEDGKADILYFEFQDPNDPAS